MHLAGAVVDASQGQVGPLRTILSYTITTGITTGHYYRAKLKLCSVARTLGTEGFVNVKQRNHLTKCQ